MEMLITMTLITYLIGMWTALVRLETWTEKHYDEWSDLSWNKRQLYTLYAATAWLPYYLWAIVMAISTRTTVRALLPDYLTSTI